MPTLLTFPNEVLLEIIEDVCPDDLLNFALSCKHVLSLSQGCLKLHIERKQIYNTVGFHGCPRHDHDAQPTILVQQIFDDWRIASYPKSMTIKCCDCRGVFKTYNEHKEGFQEIDDDDDVGDAEEAEDPEPFDRAIKDFERAIMKKINETEIPRHQAARVKVWGIGERGAMLGFLLTMLPHLEKITLEQYTWSANTFRTILWNIVEANLDPDYTGPILLPKLEEVAIVRNDFNKCEDAEVFGCFALLPCMKSLVGHRVESGWVTGEDDIDYRWPRRDNHTSAVAAIEFRESAISFGYFSQLLRGITSLRRFTYGFNGGHIGTDPYRLVDLLLLHSKTTLEHLELKGFAGAQFDSYGGAGSGSLRDFEVLKDVHVHSRLWAVHEEEYDETLQLEEWTTIPLVDALPTCIESVQLEGVFDMKEADRLLTGLTGPKGRRLHRLRRVVFRDMDSPSDFFADIARVWKEGCAVFGVSLEFEWAA